MAKGNDDEFRIRQENKQQANLILPIRDYIHHSTARCHDNYRVISLRSQ